MTSKLSLWLYRMCEPQQPQKNPQIKHVIQKVALYYVTSSVKESEKAIFPWRVHYMSGNNITEALRNAVLISQKGVTAACALELPCHHRIDLRDLLQPHITMAGASKARLHLKPDDSINLAATTLPSIWWDSRATGERSREALRSSVNTNHSSLAHIEPSCFPNTPVLSLHRSQVHRAIIHHFTANLSPIRHSRKPIQPEEKKNPISYCFTITATQDYNLPAS